MAFPIKICAICSEEFELRPDKPGFANRCPSCSVDETPASKPTGSKSPADAQLYAERKRAMRTLLYRKDE